MSRLAAAAARYAALGWAIHPLRPRSKRPLTRRGLYDATSVGGRVAEWWRSHPSANVALACGEASGVVVIDVDGPAGEWSWAELCVGHAVPETLESRTGRAEGGRQLFWQWPGRRVKNRASLAEGLDVRGDGGYVVLPPSIHPDTGTRYRWLTRMEPAPMPEWLARLLVVTDHPRPPAPPPRQVTEPGGSRYGLAALRRACDAVRGCPEGSRSVLLWQQATSIGELVAGGEIPRARAEADMVAAGYACGLDPHEPEEQVEKGLREGAKRPRGAPL